MAEPKPTPQIAIESNPLLEAKPHSFEELFSRDPLDLEKRDIEQIVSKLREDRVAWRAAELEGKRSPPKGAVKAPKPKPTAAELDAALKELGLD